MFSVNSQSSSRIASVKFALPNIVENTALGPTSSRLTMNVTSPSTTLFCTAAAVEHVLGNAAGDTWRVIGVGLSSMLNPENGVRATRSSVGGEGGDEHYTSKLKCQNADFQ